MIKARYIVGILAVAAVSAGLKAWNRPDPAPAVFSTGSLLDAHEESLKQSIDDLAQRGAPAKPPPK